MMDSHGKGDRQAGEEQEADTETGSVKRSLSKDFENVATPGRGQKRQAESPGSSVTKYYRLDYMFGKSSEKVAKQAVQPLSPAQQQALASAEPVAESAAVVLPARKSKGGRPKGSGRKQKQKAAGVRKQRADPTAQAKLNLSRELRDLQQQPGVSKYKARQAISERYGLSMTAVRNLEKTDKVAELEKYVEQKQVGKTGLRRQGSHLAASKQASQAQGSRIAKAGNVLGRTDRCRKVWAQTAMWAQFEESQQHVLSLEDLVRDYQHRLQTAIEARQQLEVQTEQQQAELKAWRQKVQTLQNKPKQRSKEALKLANRAGLRQAELCKRMDTAWRQYDQLLFKAGQPIVQSELPVRDREAWFVNRRETALTFNDQIPVWLKPAPGKTLVSTVRQEKALQQRRRKRMKKKQAEKQTASAEESGQQQLVAATDETEEPEAPVQAVARSPGQAARWRDSFIARQRIEDWFQPDKLPTGKVLPSVLLVYGTHCRLENISQTGHWVESESFEFQGQTVRREAGQKVLGVLMRQWRQLREERPELF